MLDPNAAVSEQIPNREFTKLATDEQIASVVKALEANNIHVIVVESGAEARKLVLQLVPPGAEVYANISRTLEKIGVTDEIDKSGGYNAVRPKVLALDRKTQAEEIRLLRSRPAYIIGSVHAITEQGQILTASNGGSQLAPYAYGASKVILVAGTQKIVKDLNEGFRRIEEYSYPLEDARLRATLGVPSSIGKILIVNREIIPGRTTIILVKEELGF
ncbi:MAG TPA: LUD domain-containing protein [Anaerolineales bacterium]|nr:LUD domain-containing protein [Anaerolineales bacterium]HLO33332.1 LUD domain-containing protein [Anaerolineales bacterium]